MKKADAKMEIRFWGVRGSIPTPGKDFLKYGGNTSCVEVRCGNTILIFDSGSGIKDLGFSLVKEFADKQHEVNLFISHTHWDHIQGFPFFNYIYMKNKVINIYGGHLSFDIETLLQGQMKREYFPVLLEEVQSKLNFIDIKENPIKIKNINVYHTHMLHPALSLGFRVEYLDKVFVYATDNELIYDKEMPGYNISNIGNLIKGADVLVADCQYTGNEYSAKVGWGHSALEGIIDICIEFGVKILYTYHHDPYHDDKYLDGMIKVGKNRAGNSLKVFGAKEGIRIEI